MVDDLCHDFTSISFSEHVSNQEDLSMSDGASSTYIRRGFYSFEQDNNVDFDTPPQYE